MATRNLSINTAPDKLGSYKQFKPTSYSKDRKSFMNYNICLMNEYEDRFPFLIRLEDYRKGDTFLNYLNSSQNNQMNNGGFGQNNTGMNNNSFGNNNAGMNNNNSFGNNNASGFSTGFGQNNAGFGNNNANGFGQNKTGFGGFGQNNTNTGFGNGNNNGFGNNSTTSFGNNNNSSFGGFGQNNANKPGGFGGFGNNNNASGFGNNTGFGQNNANKPGGFGGFGNNNNTGFGQNNNNTSGFGGFGNNNNTSSFGNTNNASGGFGQNKSGFGFGQNNTTGGFGQNNNTGGFGQNNTTGGFGQNNNTGGFGQNKTGFGFGSNNNTTGGFGSNNNTTGGFGFGSNNNTTGGFGQNNTGGFGQNKTGFGFGSNNNTTGGFGSNNNTTGGFGSNNTGGFGQNKTGFGFGFGSNNTTGGFGQNNTTGGFGGFGTNTMNSGGFGSNATMNAGPNGLIAGGFNTINTRIQEDPYNHLQNLTTNISNTEKQMVNQNPSRVASTHNDSMSNYMKSYSTSQRLVNPASLVKPTQSSFSTSPVVINSEQEKKIGVQYQTSFHVFSLKSSTLIAQLEEEAKKVFNEQESLRLLYNQIILAQDVTVYTIPEGAILTAVKMPGAEKQTTSFSYQRRGPILTKPGYSISPSIDELSAMMNFELCRVPHVVVEHEGVGKIEWDEPIDLTNINLDEVIEIELNESGSSYISVYENIGQDSPSYPPVGTGINHPAVLTFYKIFPAKGSSIPEDVLREKTKAIGGEFISYDAATGTWCFRVPHFTKYGLDFSDEETLCEEIKGRPAQDLKRIEFDSLTDLFYQSKQPRVFKHTLVKPGLPTPVLSHTVTKPITCPSSRASVLSLLKQTPFCTTRTTTSQAASFTSLFYGNTLITTQNLTHIHTESIFDETTTDELDNLLEILRSFTYYTENEQGSVPQIQLQRNQSMYSLLHQLMTSYSEHTPSAWYKRLLFQLLQILFISPENGSTGYVWTDEESFSPADLSSEQQQYLLQKRRLFNRWLEEAMHSPLWHTPSSPSDSVFSTCLDFLMLHDIEHACQCLKDEGYERLALQLAQINCSEDFRTVMAEQVDQWKAEGVLQSIDPAQYRLLSFLAGDSCILTDSLSWVAKLALYSWYIASPLEPLEAVLSSFLFSVVREDEFISPWYASSHPGEEEEGLFLLIEFFVHRVSNLEYDESVLFQPQNYSPDPMDSSLPFLISLVLSTQLLAHFDSSIHLALSFSFMEQLNAIHCWQWAVFIALFQPHTPLRQHLVQTLLGQHIGECVRESEEEGVEGLQKQIKNVLEHEKISAVVNDFGVSPKIVYEALTYYAHYTHNVLLEVTCQLSAEDFNGAFLTLLREIIPVAIRKNDLSLLQMSLNFFANQENKVLLWREIGDILEGYIDFLSLERTDHSFDDGRDLLIAIQGWKQFESIIQKKDLDSMIHEMNWRILARLLECVQDQQTVDWDHIHFIIQQLSSLSINYDIKKLLYDTLGTVVPM